MPVAKKNKVAPVEKQLFCELSGEVHLHIFLVNILVHIVNIFLSIDDKKKLLSVVF